ncbi:MAG: hypothetical protein DCC53_02730 [Chloroflexi bacterium]|nr:MAG: hypothetical protein UZ13_02471 [Chloroflexi bacterium OLB13]MBV6435371.1 hypothetical protein [Anaerolineae bacterium]RIK22710.1 MAG: hypothetical protein DCC53_02730 [Chloroflexota bacterium]
MRRAHPGAICCPFPPGHSVRHRLMKRFTVILLGLCSGWALAVPPPDTRPFYLGFTPFPHEISVEAVQYTYDRIAEDADLIVQHFDNGVPWPEALDGAPFAQAIQDDWAFRRGLTPTAHRVLLTFTPINFLRDGLAAYRGDQEEMPLPPPFDSYGFDHPDVIAAFTAYADRIITYFEPDFVLFGIEVNLLMKHRPDLWDAYMVLHRATYEHLKRAYPDLPVMVSVTGIDLLDGYTDADHADQMRALSDILDYTDIVALSIYPYMTRYMTREIPRSIYEMLAELIDKPLAVSETGYPAQSFTIDAGAPIQFDGTPELQDAWITLTLDAAARYKFAFVVNFVLRDYDTLWQQIGGQNDLTIIWRDTGLYDEHGQPRPALATWRDWLERPVTPVP